MNLEEVKRWADSRNTSDEVACAIMTVASDDLEEAARIWEDPTVRERTEIERCAWALTDADADALFWGAHTMRRER